MWSHYAQKHQGLCFAFEVKSDIFVDVRYTQERLFPEITNETFFNFVGEDQMQDLFGTKHTHWAYEEEVRTFVDLSDKNPDDEGRHFFEFENDIQLRKVYLGPDTYWGKTDIEDVLTDKSITIIPTRRAFRHFKVVRQKDQELWKLRAKQ